MATAKPTRVRAERIVSQADPADELLDRIARLLDSRYRIPGTSIRFGLDAIAGIFPVVGDIPAGLVQAGLIGMGMYYYKIPKSVIARMVFNVLLDTTVGSIPILGTIFDIGYRANLKNVNLLRDAATKKRGR